MSPFRPARFLFLFILRHFCGGTSVTTLTTESIQKAVSEALEEAKSRHLSDRLQPFTAAEMRFIQDVVEGALTRALSEDKG